MRKSLKPCMQAGCSKLVENGYCDEHRPAIKPIDNRKAFKVLDSKKDPRTVKFYTSRPWIKTSKLFRKKYPLCQRCKQRGLIVPAQLVHHKKELLDIWRDKESPYSWHNLESLCNTCHLEDLRAKKLKASSYHKFN